MKCTKLIVKIEFQYNSESPFSIDLKWDNPSSEQIKKVRDYILKQFDEEIERVS